MDTKQLVKVTEIFNELFIIAEPAIGEQFHIPDMAI